MFESFLLSLAMVIPLSVLQLLWGAFKLGQVAVYFCVGRQARPVPGEVVQGQTSSQPVNRMCQRQCVAHGSS